MPDTKITALTAIGANPIIPSTFPIPMVDLTDTSMAASGTTKKVTVNQILGAGGTATLASATITGDLTVDTSTLKVDSANNRVGVLTASPAYPLDVNGRISYNGAIGEGANQTVSSSGVSLQFGLGSAWTSQLFYITGTEQMRLNATGLGVGVSPAYKLDVAGTAMRIRSASAYSALVVSSQDSNAATRNWAVASTFNNYGDLCFVQSNAQNGDPLTAGTVRFQIDSSGNVGIGVTPSAWRSGARALQLGANKYASLHEQSSGAVNLCFAAYEGSANVFNYTTGDAASRYALINGQHQWFTAPSGTINTAITFTQAMTLDASGNLLVGITSGSFNRIKKDAAADAGNAIFELVGASNATSSIHYSVSSYNANAANAASKFGRDGVTLRSINAGGTVNASGADYAEYMTKAGGFVLSKGDIAGIDANGKLTNVFADSVSFVVKSTDPSYVGNDKWGNDLEGDELEAARQLVDRIAFAGQVPVNVIGAKSGDYIVPVVDGTGIKGIAVSNPTFEQYQLAVGKVIAIDADGRARIIVKVA